MQHRRRTHSILSLAVTACFLIGAVPAHATVQPVAHPVRLGVATPGVNPQGAHPGIALERYASKVGAMPRIAMWYETWYGGRLSANRVMDAVANHGVTPMITWMPK